MVFYIKTVFTAGDSGYLPAAKELLMSLILSWLGHASFQISGMYTVYIDPWKIDGEPHDGDFVLVSHIHDDHLSRSDIKAVLKEDGKVITCADGAEELGFGTVLAPGEVFEEKKVRILGVPAYNSDKPFHPRENNWLGFIVEMEGKRIYYAGDTDTIEEIEALKGLDIALLPVGGTYTFDAESAAEAVNRLQPVKAVPYHWGDIVGNRKDAVKFAKKADVPVDVLSPMDYLTIE